MTKIRIAFSKEDPVRWLSHLDTQKLFERALRRADIPLAFSEGFNPHPKIAFASALAVGVVSLSEYVDIELAAEVDPDVVGEKLQKAMPEGVRILGVTIIPHNAAALMAVINRADYRLRAALTAPVTEEHLAATVEKALQQTSWLVERDGKRGVSTKDIRAGVFRLQASLHDQMLLIETLVQTGSEGNVRPDEVLRVLMEQGNLPVDQESLRIIRVGLYIAKGDQLRSPMEEL
ncbi:TIGR03936 family radical SAM-associated protein [Heliophilum fasciatum]|uniref:Radical SAM-linked protein n=1 Tax=Heliophilum fasciatum TaxID=35700 RepID=A0A4R2RZC7_9FIRM|nr:TIGR03936 family radical SAM-associated protein [Heliophilum fasciatum]MCW2277126.1 radical SAM-linked protein [Heliophilum fasciatum]TCP68237.1 radical SAM-linked protein [Heliophilum fasciatum]